MLKPAVSRAKGQGYFRCTPRQMDILRSINRRNKDGTCLDVYQLIELISPGVKRESMLSSLRWLARYNLVEDGPIEYRRGVRGMRSVRTYQLTQAGVNFLKPKNLP